MPILTTPGGGDENDPYNVIFSSDVDSTTSPFCDDVTMTSTTGRRPEVRTTENDDVDDADDVDSDVPKKRGPKKQPMTKARMAKVKVRRFVYKMFMSIFTANLYVMCSTIVRVLCPDECVIWRLGYAWVIYNKSKGCYFGQFFFAFSKCEKCALKKLILEENFCFNIFCRFTLTTIH